MKKRLAYLSVIVGLISCGATGNGYRWGDGVFNPSINKTFISLKRSTLHPMTIYPTSLAILFSLNNRDKKISNWAYRNTPVFGSQESANKASDNLRDFLKYQAFASSILTSRGNSFSEWTISNTKGALVELLAFTATHSANSLLKKEVGRTRPNGTDNLSFPSGHSSDSSSYAAMVANNINYISIDYRWKGALKVSSYALASSVAWASVEGNNHYITDVLIGIALGNFITNFIYNSFLGSYFDDISEVKVFHSIGMEETQIKFRYAF